MDAWGDGDREENRYNEGAVKPFLGKPRQEKRKNFRGEAAFPDTLAAEDRNYYYHATTLENLEGILDNGLDPERGGIGGAGTLIAGEKNYEPGVTKKGFNKRSHGYVHAAEDPKVVVPYAFQYDDMADGFDQNSNAIEPNKAVVTRAPVILRFRKDIIGENLEIDSKQRGAIKTTQQIPTEKLEILTENGWESLESEVTRNNIRESIGEIKSGIEGRHTGEEHDREEHDREEHGRERTNYSDLEGEETEQSIGKRKIGTTTLSSSKSTEPSKDASLS